MNNQNDTQKTYTNINNQGSVLNAISLPNMSFFDFISKRTEKLVTALYMVSDCMDSDDFLKGKLRALGVELLSDTYHLSIGSTLEKNTNLVINRVHEILSFIEISYTMGYISEMNSSILKNEFISLVNDIKSNQEKTKSFAFKLDETMFSIKQKDDIQIDNKKNGLILSDNHFQKDNQIKRTSLNELSFINNSNSLKTLKDKRTTKPLHIIDNKSIRTDKMLSFIKNFTIKTGKNEITIKDIVNAFSGISEKTIQRDLTHLVSNKQLTKSGNKRWSRYSVVTE